MRRLTQREAKEWHALAQAYGFVNDAGEIAAGGFIAEPDGDGEDILTLTFVTPILAPAYTSDSRRKTPPILFDRNDGGEIVLPGRWWADMLERSAGTLPDALRLVARCLTREGAFSDIVLPCDVDTVAFEMLDDDGNHVTFEALPPGLQIAVQVAVGGSSVLH